jgi:hypothetical protein
MKFNELIKLKKEDLDGKSFYRIEVDNYVSLENQIDGVEEIGFLVKYNADNSYLDDDLIDIIIMLGNKDIRVLLEVPFSNNINIDIIHHLARSTRVNVSYLPPPVDSPKEIFQVFKDKIVKATELWLEQQNDDYVLFPSSGYFEYMIRRQFNGTSEAISTEKYAIENFVETMNIEDMDEIKSGIEAVFLEHLGGQEGFEIYANSIAAALINNVEDAAKNFIDFDAEHEMQLAEQNLGEQSEKIDGEDQSQEEILKNKD